VARAAARPKSLVSFVFGRKSFIHGADAPWLDGRVKPGHDED